MWRSPAPQNKWEAGFDQSFLDPALSVAWDTQVTIADVCWWQRLAPSSLGLFGHVTLEMALSWCGVVFWHKKEQASGNTF